jgi:hypothetical protein
VTVCVIASVSTEYGFNLLQAAMALLPVPSLDARKLTISYMSAEASDVTSLKLGQPRR